MEKYKFIHFESMPIQIKRITDTLFHPNAKHWNKLFELCSGFVKAVHYLKSENIDLSVYKLEMNKPAIIRNCGLNNMKGLRLEGIEFVETDYIFPSGQILSKRAQAYYNMVSIKYVMLNYKKEGRFEYVQIIKHSRLEAYLKGNNVKKYELKIDSDNYKIIIN